MTEIPEPKRWADLDDDEDSEEEEEQWIKIEEDKTTGVITAIKVYTNAENDLKKVTKKYREHEKLVDAKILRRKGWGFGKALTHPPTIPEPSISEWTISTAAAPPVPAGGVLDAMSKKKQDLKNLFQKLRDAENGDLGVRNDIESDLMMDDSFGGSRPAYRQDGYKLRVTNLSEDATDSDLRALFKPFGSVINIFLAKDRETRASKGFAFVSFESFESADDARKKLNRHVFDRLILGVEWAKPPTR